MFDGFEIGQGSAEPTFVHKELSATDGFFPDGVLGLFLGTDEQNPAASGRDVEHGFVSYIDAFARLLEIDDVDAVTRCVDELCHLGVPSARLVSEMYACLKQGFH